jgi:hypothetical protein
MEVRQGKQLIPDLFVVRKKKKTKTIYFFKTE